MTEHSWVPSEGGPRRHCQYCGIYEDYQDKYQKCEREESKQIDEPGLFDRVFKARHDLEAIRDSLYVLDCTVDTKLVPIRRYILLAEHACEHMLDTLEAG